MHSFYQSLTPTMLAILGLSSLVLSLSFASCACFLINVPPLPQVRGGHRGKMRSLAREQGWFRLLEPKLLYLAALTDLALRALRRKGGEFRRFEARLSTNLKQQLVCSGQPLGLDHREFIALCFLNGVLGGSLGFLFGRASSSLVWVAPLFLVFLLLPLTRLQSLRNDRFLQMSRQLPAIIDLMAMAMNAGSDFPGALRRVVEGQKGVVGEELGQVLVALDLGITRATALLALRERIPVADVRDLVRAVLLADKKGSPLTEALVQQARLSRQRRSERAEEAAARAGVWMLLPLMLLMLCILILVIGPMVCGGAEL